MAEDVKHTDLRIRLESLVGGVRSANRMLWALGEELSDSRVGNLLRWVAYYENVAALPVDDIHGLQVRVTAVLHLSAAWLEENLEQGDELLGVFRGCTATLSHRNQLVYWVDRMRGKYTIEHFRKLTSGHECHRFRNSLGCEPDRVMSWLLSLLKAFEPATFGEK